MYTAINYKKSQSGKFWNVELVRKEDNRHFWVDVDLDDDYHDIEAEWNQYIFDLTNEEDLARKEIQENNDEFDLATSEAICFLEAQGEITQDENGLWY